MDTRAKRLALMTFKTFFVIMAAILAAVTLFLASVLMFGNIGIVVAIVVLIILLASYLYSSERLKEVEREEERFEEKVKQDYSYVKRVIEGKKNYY